MDDEEFSFAQMYGKETGIMRMKVKEGSCLSVLGTITLDQTGQLKMTNLIAVIAGGLKEVKKYLWHLSSKNRFIARCLLGASALSLLGCFYCFYLSYEHRKQEKDNENARAMLLL